ncbi:hypothetical protein GCM10010211_80850 [Streptomyces albospinus]|uniref:Transposase n=1 Tax=Streptomyces albospinus TaxID=285515 RepID=A0ABQ2VN93_9ACTN|nr:hypothetical protein GCM10010211_80850 [Streptomyces albospinus]
MMTIAKVSYGGDTRPQLLLGVDAHACQGRVGIFVCHRLLRLAVGVEGEVYVRVDQPGQQRGVTEIQNVQVCRRMRPGHVDTYNARAIDEHKWAPGSQCVPVKEPRRADSPGPSMLNVSFTAGNHPDAPPHRSVR